MKKRIILTACLALVFLAGLAILFWPRPVHYEGKELADWCRGLTSSTPATRDSAAAFFRSFPPAALPDLIRLLEVRDPGLNKTVWNRARQIPLKVRRHILERVSPPDAALVRLGAARALGLLGTNAVPAIPALAQSLGHPDYTFALECGQVLGRLGPPAIPAVLPLLEHPSATVRQLAIFALGQSGPGAAIALDSLTQALDDPDPLVRTRAREVFRGLGVPGFEVAANWLRHGAPADRMQAAAMLAEIQGKLRSAVPSLTQMTRDAAPEVRISALKTLSVMRATQRPVTLAVGNLLRDPEPAVRAEAVRALRSCSPNEISAITNLPPLLRDASPVVQRAALDAVAEFGPAAAELRDLVQPLTNSPDATVAEAAAKALASTSPHP